MPLRVWLIAALSGKTHTQVRRWLAAVETEELIQAIFREPTHQKCLGRGGCWQCGEEDGGPHCECGGWWSQGTWDDDDAGFCEDEQCEKEEKEKGT